MGRDLDIEGTRSIKIPNSLQVYDAERTEMEGWSRILLMGAAKSGKTCACTLTAPKPVLVMNCDGPSALVGAAALGAKFRAVDVSGVRQWRDAVRWACDLASDEQVQTIVVDTLTLLADSVVEDLARSLKGFDLWGKVKDELMGGVRDLRNAEAHLIVTAHAMPEDSLVGVLPAIPGKAGSRIPAMLHDWIWLDVDTSTSPPERKFLVGPQKSWNHGARNAKRSVAIEADLGILFDELGIKP